MTIACNRFYSSIDNAAGLSQAELIDFFVYYLTVEAGSPFATAAEIRKCFEECDLHVPSRIPQHLSEGAKAKPPKFLRAGPKHPGAYKLHRHLREALEVRLGAGMAIKATPVALRRLEATLPEGEERKFLSETIDCFEVGALRATIVMCWILAVDHLFDHVLRHKLAEFNAALAKNPAGKLKAVTSRDDLSEIPEGKFVELCRSAGIVSNDVRKILEEKLGTRNSCAHPSTVTIKESKVIDFVEDLATNILLKFKI